MRCPICKSDYIETIKVCPNCQVELVNETCDNLGKSSGWQPLNNTDNAIIEEKNIVHVKFVTLIQSKDSSLIDHVQKVIKDAGIQCFVQNENPYGRDIMSNIGPFKALKWRSRNRPAVLKIAEKDYTNAKELIQELMDEIDELGSE